MYITPHYLSTNILIEENPVKQYTSKQTFDQVLKKNDKKDFYYQKHNFCKQS